MLWQIVVRSFLMKLCTTCLRWTLGEQSDMLLLVLGFLLGVLGFYVTFEVCFLLSHCRNRFLVFLFFLRKCGKHLLSAYLGI